MIPLIDDYQKIDMFTPHLGLANLVFGNYPEKIALNSQCHVDTSEPGVEMYCFYDLRKGALMPFLEQYGTPYAYELRRSMDGDFVAVHPKA